MKSLSYYASAPHSRKAGSDFLRALGGVKKKVGEIEHRHNVAWKTQHGKTSGYTDYAKGVEGKKNRG